MLKSRGGQKTFRLACLFVLPVLAAGQENKMIDLRSADVLNVRYVNGEEVHELVGHVHFIQITATGERVLVWCDRAVRHVSRNMLELFGNVKIVRDSATITSPEGTYYANERRAEMLQHVRLEKGTTTLTARYGEHFVDEKRSFFRDDVTLVDSTSTVTCNALTYFENEQKSVATGNVKVVNAQNAVIIFGDSLVHFDRQNYTLVPKNPLLMQIDTSSAGVVDTFVVASRIMHAYRDSTQRFVAQDSVVMARSELSARAGLATYYARGDLIALQNQPVVWERYNQMTGDSIAVTLKNKKLYSVYVKGRAMTVSRADSVHPNRFDQLSGRELTMYFAQSRLQHVDVERNATSLYYLYDKDEPNGANKSSGDSIAISFLEGRVDRIKVVGGVQGQYFPEKLIANRERDYNLDGFRWFDVRPRRKNAHIVLERYE